MSTKNMIGLSTIDGEDKAVKIAEALVEAKLAACVNIVPELRSIYTWEGKIKDEKECLLIIKTSEDCVEDLKKKVTDLHSYEVPELIFTPIKDGLEKYIEWMNNNLKK